MNKRSFIIGLTLFMLTFLGCGDDNNNAAGSGGTGSAGDESGTGGSHGNETDASEDVAEAEAGPGTGGADSEVKNAGKEVVDADEAEPLPECPEGTECMSPMGNTWCGFVETHLLPRCETDDDCDFGICVHDVGHGWCYQPCESPGGIPEEVTITGKVVDYVPHVEFEFSVTEYLNENQPSIEGAQVCVHENSDIPCVNSGSDGVFKLQSVPYNLMDISLSVTKDGYQSVLWFLEGGTQRDRVLETVIPLYTNEQFEQWATTAGADYPEETTGAIFAGAAKLKTENEDSPFTTSFDGGGDYVFVDGFTVVLEPQSGIGPVYLDAEEALDSSLNVASIIGRANFFNLEPGDYTLHFTHPDLDCGDPFPVKVVAGFVKTRVGGLCFPRAPIGLNHK